MATATPDMRYLFQLIGSSTVFERQMTVAEMLATKTDDGFYMVDGVKCERNFSAEQGGAAFGNDLWREFKSDGAGCHPTQAAAFQDWANQRGCGVKFDGKTGQAVFNSKRQRDQYLRLRGLVDKG